jgi:hypothetical protein
MRRRHILVGREVDSLVGVFIDLADIAFARNSADKGHLVFSGFRG